MRVFSASIEAFLGKMSVFTKTILRDEFGTSVARTRFQTKGGWSWPIVLVAVDDADRLGYFDPKDCSIGIHKSLMYSAKDRVLKDLLRHELAHYFTYIHHHASGIDPRSHGAQFQATCDTYGLSEEARRASMDVRSENDAIAGELENEAVLARLGRLLSLAESDNEHEAALAVLRANELMLRHNLDATTANSAKGSRANEIEYCVKVVVPCKRSSPRVSAIAEILAEFLVFPVQGAEGLEVTGTRANVENADYMANYLNRALAAAWKRARAAQPERKLREKPFMAAAAESYVEKLRRSKSKLPENDRNALIVLDQEIAWAGRGAYGGGVHVTTSTYRTCADSTSQGARAGAALEIRRGISGKGTVTLIG